MSVADHKFFQKSILRLFGVFLSSSLLGSPLLVEDAETVSDTFTADTAEDYSAVQSDTVPQGDYAFHLTHTYTDQTDQTLLFNDTIIPTSSSFIFWESRLRAASSIQEARVEVMEPGGISWDTIWLKQGDGGFGESLFTLEKVSLAQYAGRELMLRFRYLANGYGSISVGSETFVGWIFDNIQVADSFQTREWSIGEPTAQEQLILELLNRARQDSNADLQRLLTTSDKDIQAAYEAWGVDLNALINQFSGYDFGAYAQYLGQDTAIPASLPPLAPNVKLREAALLHSQDMFDNQFQEHASSSNTPSPHNPGDQVAERVTYQGYGYKTVAENLSSYSNSAWESHAAFIVDWGINGETQGSYKGMQDPAGHRYNVFSDAYREIGVGVIEGINGEVGPMVISKAFGTELTFDQPFVTGVAFHDVDGDGYYSAGEGVGSVTVTVEGVTYHGETPASGGYAIPLQENGNFVLNYELPDGSTSTQDFTVSNLENTKVDIMLDWNPTEISGSSLITLGNKADYTQPLLPTATAYRWNFRSVDAWSQTFGAEVDEPVTGSPTGDFVTSYDKPDAAGEKAYRLVTYDEEPNDSINTVPDVYLTLDDTFLPSASSELVWYDRVHVVSESQNLDVEISLDGGNTWTTLDSRNGVGINMESVFTERRLSLTEYAGVAVNLRFAIINPFGSSYYNGTEFYYGWYIDDISLTDTDVLSSTTSQDTLTPSWSFTPSSEGEYVLQAQVINETNVYTGGPLFTVEVIASNSRDTLLEGTAMVSTWFNSSWFGTYFVEDTEWLYRPGLGWLFYGQSSGSGAWFYESGSLGWIWVEPSVFPNFYRSSDNTWYNLLESSGTYYTYKFDESSQSWVEVN